MRVGLSMLTLVPGLSGGSETYARGLARALAAHRSLGVVAYVSTLAPEAGEGLPTEVVEEYRAATTTLGRVRAMAMASVFTERIGLRFQDLDVVHYPLTVPLPRLPRVRSRVVVTVHDIQHLDLPELFPRVERAFRKVAYDRAARGADITVVPSSFVRDRVVDRLGLDPRLVHVIPHGVDHTRFTPGTELREPFLLYPARPWRHKNHGLLLEAFALLRAEQHDLRLVLTGAGTEALDGPPGVEARGAVPHEELVSLYRRTSCLVFPSRYEGFGAPPLEAMACAAPVAAARAGSLPEVCGDAAVLFDPNDAAAIARGVSEAITRSSELAVLGPAQAARFTWAACAERHEDAYRAASTRS